MLRLSSLVFLLHPFIQGRARVLGARIIGSEAVVTSVAVQTPSATAVTAVVYVAARRCGAG